MADAGNVESLAGLDARELDREPIVIEGVTRHGVAIGSWQSGRIGIPVTLLTFAFGLIWLGVWSRLARTWPVSDFLLLRTRIRDAVLAFWYKNPLLVAAAGLLSTGRLQAGARPPLGVQHPLP